MNHQSLALPFLFMALTGSASAGGEGDRWPEFRGPGRDGRAPAAEVPLAWSESKNVAWKTGIHGRGWSTPVVWDGEIWLTTASADGTTMSVLDVELASGEILVDRQLFEIEQPEHRNRLNSYASPSPVIEEDRVYVHFGTYGTACLNTESGATIWERRDIHCDHMEGPGSSPILFEDLLILTMDGGDVQFVTALDKATGKTQWKTERSMDLSGFVPDMRKGYNTPILVEANGKLELVSSGAQATYGYDPRTGEELWRLKLPGFSMSSMPISGEGLVFVNTGFLSPSLRALRPGGKGDVTDSHLVWTQAKGMPTMPSPVLVDGRIYTVNQAGSLSCLDAKTGERVWRERIGGQHCASLVHAGQHVFLFDREGTTKVVEPGPEFRLVATNELDGGFMASPAILSDGFVLRTEEFLYRIQEDSE